MSDPSPEIEPTETAAGYDADLLVMRHQLEAALAAQAEWDTLMDRVIAERATEQRTAGALAAELAAIKSSTSWRLIWLLLSPYRRARAALHR
ncbi:MAG: hypothetical protein ACI8TP_002876 [Acidimicrobiales bacterium]